MLCLLLQASYFALFEFKFHFLQDTPQINRPSLNQSNENTKQQQLPEIPKSHPYKSPETNLTNASIRSDQSSIDIGMKTFRISHTDSNTNQNAPSIQQSVNQSYNINNSPTKAQPESDKAAVAASGEAKEVAASSGSGLVRRLSVTARPGDIFYKVKDVTESSSSTDTNESPGSSVTKVSVEETINPSKSYTVRVNDEMPSSTPVVQQTTPTPQKPQPQPQPQLQKQQEQQQGFTSFGSMGRKTTTWNVKKNQTTNPFDVENNNNNINNNNNNTSAAESSHVVPQVTAEPGSPMFNKELLNIRYVMLWYSFGFFFVFAL